MKASAPESCAGALFFYQKQTFDSHEKADVLLSSGSVVERC